MVGEANSSCSSPRPNEASLVQGGFYSKKLGTLAGQKTSTKHGQSGDIAGHSRDTAGREKGKKN